MWSKDYPMSAAVAWRSLLGIAILAAGVFLPTALQAEFLNFDDGLFFDPDTNAAFAEGGLSQILHPGRTIANVYLPVSHLSLYLDYQLSGTDPLWPHLHSLLLHVLTAWLLVHLGIALGLRALPAFAAACAFTVHPALVESVAWVSSRKDVLSGLFTMLALLAVALSCRRTEPRLMLAAVLFGALALYSKATAIVLPGLAGLVCLMLPGGGARRWLPVLGLGIVAAGAGCHHFVLATSEGTLAAVADPGQRAQQVPGAFLHYLRVLVWPVDLNILYPEVQTMAAFRAQFAAGLVALALTVTTAAALVISPRFRLSGLALLGVLVALAPFNTALPASSIAAADRYLYLAVPFLVLCAAGLGRGGTAVLLLGCLPLAGLSFFRAADFQDSERVWRRSLQTAPENAVARLNLSADLQRRYPDEHRERRELLLQASRDARYPVHELAAVEALRNLALQRGQHEESLQYAERAVQLSEQLPATAEADVRRLHALLDAATLLRSAGRDGEAERYFALAGDLAPDDPTYLVHRASRLLAAATAGGQPPAADDPRWPQAEALLARALAGDPRNLQAHLVRGRWLHLRGDYLLAAAAYETAIELGPQLSQGYLALADLYLSQGLPGNPVSGAEGAVRRAIARGVVDPALQQRWAIALVGQGKLATAKRLLREYLDLRPADQATAGILADLLANEAATGLYQLPTADLERLVAEVEALRVGHPQLDVVRGKMLRDAHQWEPALGHLQAAHRAFPDDLDVLRMLAETHRDRGYQLLGFGDPGTAADPPDRERRRDLAMDQFRAFLDLAPSEVPTVAVAEIVTTEGRRQAGFGEQAFRPDDPAAADLDVAEQRFRRSVFLCPEDVQYRCQLGNVLMLKGTDGLREAEALFADAVQAQRRDGLDPSLPLLFRVLSLQQLGRSEEAEQLGRDFLAAPGDANPEIVERLRAVIRG